MLFNLYGNQILPLSKSLPVKTKYSQARGLGCTQIKHIFSLKKRSAYSSGMPALAQASRVALSQTLACTSPMWTLPSSSIHRRL